MHDHAQRVVDMAISIRRRFHAALRQYKTFNNLLNLFVHCKALPFPWFLWFIFLYPIDNHAANVYNECHR